MKKSLFDDKDNWTDAGTKFCNEARRALEPVFEKYLEEGYSVRELSHIAGGAVYELECMIAIRRKDR